MNLRETLLAVHSKTQSDKVVKWIGNSQERFDELFKLFTGNEDRVISRAAWPLSYAVQAHPELIHKHFLKFVGNLRRPNLHDAVKRNTMRVLQEISIPKRFQGEIMNTCFTYISDPAEKPAVKAFSLTVLQNLARQYPDIRQELKLVIESQWENESPAFKSRAKKILREYQYR